MHTTDANAVLSLVNSAVQNLHHYMGSGCPRAERQARLAIDHLQLYSADPAVDASCCALEHLLDAVAPR
ncbi:hypothetical protein IAI53_14140 [Thauera sp. CAU 1555]|uniref:Uncharacterized protein n=1 Tax=Thauera sedimentorum TaxID=2767595 RepID=A0ABR9BCG3_9RHOO|nr:hypothetical protein [Thauera sedimentorum]MBC9073113.1 hypothetical protein [Thauera sedimentorum]MBD8504032.1 hypothetical protein [Thauera sedimentorum]